MVTNKLGRFQVGENCCAGAGSGPCSGYSGDGEFANEYEVTISGITEDGCEDCSPYNGTFTLSGGGTGSDPCYFNACYRIYDPGEDFCTAYTDQYLVLCIMYRDDTEEYVFVVSWRGARFSSWYSIYYWEKSFGGSKPNCLGVTDLDIPYDGQSGLRGCDASASICTLTSLE